MSESNAQREAALDELASILLKAALAEVRAERAAAEAKALTPTYAAIREIAERLREERK